MRTRSGFPRRQPPASHAALRLLLATLLVAAGASGCSTGIDPPETAAESASEAGGPVAPAPLPEVAPGESLEDVARRLAGWPPGHRFTAPEATPAGWEWSGPDGMRIEAYAAGSRVVSSRVSRTWGSGVPVVQGRALPGHLTGESLEALARRIGPGLLVERTRTEAADQPASLVLETYKWSIHDRGLDTGLYLTVAVRDGRIVAVRHAWSRS